MQSFQLTGEPPKKRSSPQPKVKREKRDNSHWAKNAEKTGRMLSLMVPPADPVETHFRHSGWKATRSRVRQGLLQTGINDFALNRFDECGSECTVEYSPSLKKIRLRANYCHCRHCMPCMRAKANKIAGNLRNHLKQKQRGTLRFVTLTLRHTNQPLREQITRLYESWRSLRRMREWKKSQFGGAVMLEVKWSPKTRQWHPHLHVISEGNYLDKRELCACWQEATGDSFIADIRRLDKAEDAAHYVCKYVVKGTSSEVWQDPEAAQEWILATKGVRTCATFGRWRGFKLTAAQVTTDDWRKIGRYTTILRRAEEGCEASLAIIMQTTPTDEPDERSPRRQKQADSS